MCKSQQNKGYPLPTSYCFFFIVSRLFPFVTTQSSNWYGKLSLFFVYSTANFEVAQGGFPSRFLPRIFPAAPNQHRLFCDLRQEPGNTGPHLLLVICFYIHSKTACRGFKSFCPCQKSQVSLVRYLTFFVSVRKDLATRCARRPACGACRGGLQPGGLHPGPTEPAGETSPMSIYACFPIRLHLPPTVLIPSSTQNAPGFAFFWLNRVRFPLFCCFSGTKFSCRFLCILPHSGYKLKPSVIPCRREVSFLT